MKVFLGYGLALRIDEELLGLSWQNSPGGVYLVAVTADNGNGLGRPEVMVGV